MPVHSISESDFQAAHDWLNSLGDDFESDEDLLDSTVASSPSDIVTKPVPIRREIPTIEPLHALDIPKKEIKKEPKKVEPVIEVLEQSVDKRMKGDYRSGCRGVSWNRRMQAWLAFWMDGNTRRSKTFSSKVHGFEDARVLAIEFILQKRKDGNIPESASSAAEEPSIPLPVVETSRRLQRRKAT